RHPPSPPRPGPHPAGHRPELPGQPDPPAGRRAGARRGGSRAHHRRGPPAPRPGGERAGAAQPVARRSRPAAPRRTERLGRHLPAHARLRQPRGAVAARRPARRHLPRRRLHARRAPRHLCPLHRAAGLARARAATARRGAGRRDASCRVVPGAGGITRMSWFEPWEAIEAVALNDDPVERAIARATPAIRPILDGALAHREPRGADCETLLGAEGDDLVALARTADAIRAADVGDEVTYVVNRNINFTNVCFVNCQFCAFKRQRWESDAYTHGLDVVLGKV